MHASVRFALAAACVAAFAGCTTYTTTVPVASVQTVPAYPAVVPAYPAAVVPVY